MSVLGYAAYETGGTLSSIEIERRPLRPDDVRIRIRFCGVCYSDVHHIDNHFNNTVFPLVPGHEIVGEVEAVGEGVDTFKPGQFVAVGCMVDSCGTCQPCTSDEENFCERGPTMTYNGKDRIDGSNTLGGYSQTIVVSERFVVRVPAELDPASVAPLLCAGITTYSPLRRTNVGPGTKLGIVGVGGLGSMAIKFGVALGAEVTVFTTSPGKADAARALGASEVIVSTDRAQMKTVRGRLDLILDTASQAHDLNPYLNTLTRGGQLVVVGALDPIVPPVHAFILASGRRSVSGTFIGGVAETQEMLDFCAEKAIASDIELIPVSELNDALDQLRANTTHKRFVIDMSTL
ncbi:hydroxyacid dehydrogenase [Tardibacter chloracetimidivorans]|uniref:Hydroxyacid dehydrogenase n=1 Tax=Tardibacter chloracetimidivorans TaxID=1921510 RepID=A0A1L3ZSS0_9SPHN|nr:NAD(P)-dependent alcohol dehydrogenase [Tardibacter chloracetimidivorans]API58681.1 hydroxyacid dehydrogenase [Tardibacter chloracetimidivorans]